MSDIARARTPHAPARRRRLCLTVGALALALIAPGVGAGVGAASPAEAHDLPPMPISLWHDLELIGPSGGADVLTTDAAGDLWYVDDTTPHSLVRVDQRTHVQTPFPIAGRSWVTAMVGAPDGSLWFADDIAKTLNRLDPATGSITSQPLTGLSGAPRTMAIGADGNIWMSDPYGATLVRVDLAGFMTIHREPRGAQIFAMVAGPDGRIWYSRSGSDRVGAIDPISGVFSDLRVGAASGVELAVGASGSVWLSGDDELTRIHPDGTVEVHDVTAPGTSPVRPLDMVGGEIAGDADTELLFIDANYGYATVSESGSVRIDPLSGFRTEIAVDGQGHVWLNDFRSHSLLWT